MALTGPDRVRFLHGMVTNDIKRLAVGHGCRAALLSQKGRFVADLIVYAHADELWVETDRSTFAKVWEILSHHIIADDVELVDRSGDFPLAGLYGFGSPLPVEVAPHVLVAHQGVLVAGTRELGAPGLRIFGKNTLGDGVERLSSEGFEMRRIEAGTPRYGLDMDEDRLFLEAGIEDAVSYDKGCYLGQEVVARAQSRGQLNRRLVGLLFDNQLPERGSKLASADRPEAGFVTSAAFSTVLGRPVGLGYVHRTAWTPGTVLQCGNQSATVTALPIVNYA